MTSDPDLSYLQVELDVPLQGPFSYRAPAGIPPGTRVIVPFARRQLVGITVGYAPSPALRPEQVKEVERVLDDLPPFDQAWLTFTQFAARYYQRPWGEVMLPALPAPLRKSASYQSKRAGKGPVVRFDAKRSAVQMTEGAMSESPARPTLNAEQQHALDEILAVSGFQAFLLHGITGSGKTEVYLQAAERVLAAGQQVLLLVPEINLTPQLEQVFRQRLSGGSVRPLAIMHSGLSDTQRLAAWLSVTRGQAGVLLGTRLALMTPMPKLGLIVVDEEHDPSYKQQEGLRYSARDLAIWRARQLDIPIVLGSATPSLESWHHAQQGRYRCLSLTQRAMSSTPPRIRLIDTRRQKLQEGLSPLLLGALTERLEKQQQSLLFLNRRGFSPVLHCDACGWVSACIRCSAYTVLHREQTAFGVRHGLRCHHCGWQARVPVNCPDCGNHDLKPMGRGTQRLEASIQEAFPTARIARIDADSTRLKGSAQRLFDQVHAGEVDILIGTQMVSKGHDFKNLGLVGVLNADAMLFSHDFRAPERLFAQLMQVAGRAGRDGLESEVLIQTGYPDQAVYQAVLRQDYAGFARYALDERQVAGLPPFSFQALLTAEARALEQAYAFLKAAKEQLLIMVGETDQLSIYDPVPLRIVRVANIERAQLLVESVHRPLLHQALQQWADLLPELGSQHKVRWHLEVDPLEI